MANPRRLTAFLVLIGIAILSACLWFIFRGPSVSIRLDSAESTDLKFRIRSWGVNSILGLYVWSETKSEFLWAIYLGYLPADPITYGQVPAASKQNYPKDGNRPRNFEPGERFVVEVSYQYDTWIAASGSEKYFRFEVDEMGVVRYLGQSEFIPGPQIPKE